MSGYAGGIVNGWSRLSNIVNESLGNVGSMADMNYAVGTLELELYLRCAGNGAVNNTTPWRALT